MKKKSKTAKNAIRKATQRKGQKGSQKTKSKAGQVAGKGFTPSQIDQYELPERLSYFRLRRGLTQSQLAHMAGLSQTTIAQLEAGKKDPSISSLKCLARALDIHISVLFAGNEIHIFDMNRLRENYDSVEKLNPTLYFALGKVIEYAKDIGFLK